MQKIFQNIKRYVIKLIKFFAITETAAVLAYFVLKMVEIEGVSLPDLLLMAAIYYCIVVIGTSLIMATVNVGIIIYMKLKMRK